MAKRLFDDDQVYPPSKSTKYEQECVVLLLDHHIGSEDLRMKMFCDSFLVSLLASDEFNRFVEFFGKEVIEDKALQDQLRRRRGRNDWGKYLVPYFVSNRFCRIDPLHMMGNKLFVLDCIENGMNVYCYLSEELQNDKDIIDRVLKINNVWFIREKFLGNVKKNKMFALACLKYHCFDFIQYCVEVWFHDKEFMLLALETCKDKIEGNHAIFHHCFVESIDELKKDPEYMLECYKKGLLDPNSNDRKYLDSDWDVLVDDYEKTKLAIDRESFSDKEQLIKRIEKGEICNINGLHSSDMIKDWDILIALLERNCNVFTHSELEYLRDDKDFLMRAAKRRIMPEFVFMYMSEILRSDKELMVEAIKSNKEAVKYICGDLRNDKELLLTALKRNKTTKYMLSEELRHDRSFILEAVKIDGEVLLYSYFREDKEIVIEAVKQNGKIWDYIPTKFKKDPETIFATLTTRPSLLEHIPQAKKEKVIVSAAIQVNSSSILFASDELQKDEELILKAVKFGIYSGPYMDDCELDMDDSLLEKVIAFDFRCIQLEKYEIIQSDNMIRMLSTNFQNKLSGNERFCKYLLSCLEKRITLDFKKALDYDPKEYNPLKFNY